MPRLGAIVAANAQLSVPVIAALAGVVLFDERLQYARGIFRMVLAERLGVRRS